MQNAGGTCRPQDECMDLISKLLEPRVLLEDLFVGIPS